jgi:hypothetical protein
VQYLTPVGFVNLAVGFKVNPSFLDVRPATVLSDIFRRQLFGEPVSLSDYDDDARFIRRFQLHFSIGQTF